MNHVQASSPRSRHHRKVFFTLHMRISNIAEWNVMGNLNDYPEQNMVWVCYWTRISSTKAIRSSVRLGLPMNRECIMYTCAQYETRFERTQLEIFKVIHIYELIYIVFRLADLYGSCQEILFSSDFDHLGQHSVAEARLLTLTRNQPCTLYNQSILSLWAWHVHGPIVMSNYSLFAS